MTVTVHLKPSDVSFTVVKPRRDEPFVVFDRPGITVHIPDAGGEQLAHLKAIIQALTDASTELEDAIVDREHKLASGEAE